MKIVRSIWWCLRVGALLALFGWAILLYRWSREDDPRFYQFVNSEPGRVIARTFRWHEVQDDVRFQEKSPPPLTPEERAVQQRLMDRVREQAPSHQLVFDDDRVMIGQLLSETPDAVEFAETYGESGVVSLWVQRRRISALEPLTNALPEISRRDVRFQMAHPELRFYKRPPYTIMTDESFFRVEHTVRILQKLYQQFHETFSPLIRKEDGGRGIQVLFFSSETDFRAYQNAYAPQMADSSGFYSPQLDRLIVYNQATSERIRLVQEQLDKEYEKHRAKAPGNASYEGLEAWRARTSKMVGQFAEEQTLSSVRHEGAHQLFYTLGVHSETRMENEWLVEGLATYCESANIGDFDAERAGVLRKAAAEDKLIPLEELLAVRHSTGLMSLKDSDRISVAYSQSWLLVHLLMRPPYRTGFFNYIRFVREPSNWGEIQHADPLALLCRFLGVSPDQFSDRWVVALAKASEPVP